MLGSSAENPEACIPWQPWLRWPPVQGAQGGAGAEHPPGSVPSLEALGVMALCFCPSKHVTGIHTRLPVPLVEENVRVQAGDSSPQAPRCQGRPRGGPASQPSQVPREELLRPGSASWRQHAPQALSAPQCLEGQGAGSTSRHRVPVASRATL